MNLLFTCSLMQTAPQIVQFVTLNFYSLNHLFLAIISIKRILRWRNITNFDLFSFKWRDTHKYTTHMRPELLTKNWIRIYFVRNIFSLSHCIFMGSWESMTSLRLSLLSPSKPCPFLVINVRDQSALWYAIAKLLLPDNLFLSLSPSNGISKQTIHLRI